MGEGGGVCNDSFRFDTLVIKPVLAIGIIRVYNSALFVGITNVPIAKVFTCICGRLNETLTNIFNEIMWNLHTNIKSQKHLSYS